MKKLDVDDLRVAVEWLSLNEGDENGEAAACGRVAAALIDEIKRIRRNESIARIAKEANVKPSVVRRHLSRK